MYYNVQDDRRVLSYADKVTLNVGDGVRECYTVDRVAGVGGMSVTYIAKREGENKWIALKELFPKKLEGAIARRRDDGRIVIYNPLTQTEISNSRAIWRQLLRFMEHEKRLSEEASVLYGESGEINQNNADILNISGPFLSDAGNYYLKIDTFNGTPLSDFINSSRKNIRSHANELLLILSRVCLRLSALHGRGILHLDLSPANIYLARINAQTEQSPYIIDFASAINVSSDSGDHYFTCNPFSAPEIKALAELQNASHGYSCDRTSDTYSVAAMLFYAVVGEHYSINNMYSMHWRDRLCSLFPADVYGDLAKRLTAFFEKALSPDCRERFDNAKQMSDVLCDLRRQLSDSGLLCKVESDDLMGYLIFYKYPVYEQYQNDSELRVLCLGGGTFTKKTVLGLIGTGQMLDKRLKICIVSKDADKCRSELALAAPMLRDYSDIFGKPAATEKEYVSFEFCEEQDLLCGNTCQRIASKYSDYRYVIISLGENRKNAELAHIYCSALDGLSESEAVIHYYMDEDAARGATGIPHNEGKKIKLCPFNVDSYREELDKLGELAFKTHLMYSRVYDPTATRESVIDHYLRDSYSQRSSAIAALHLKYKLASVGIVTDLDKDDIPNIREKYNALLHARLGDLIMLEHKRWMMEKASEGYTPPASMEVIEGYAYTVSEKGKFIKGFKRSDPNLHHCLVPCDNRGTVLTALRDSGRWPKADSYAEVDAIPDLDELDKMSLKVHLLAERICTDKGYLKRITATVDYIEAILPDGNAKLSNEFRRMKRSITALKKAFADAENNAPRKRAVADVSEALSRIKALLRLSDAEIAELNVLRDRISVFSEASTFVDYKASDEIIIRHLFDIIGE